ncbi:MAG: peptide ABC transporter substrate-binding protein [Lachnospiraceae bacterium]|nr:peptide ABC transporter substrate-binding protein [Lachnospiraceae bacterium]
MKKKLLSAMLCTVMVAGMLSGCGSSAGTETAAETTAAEGTTAEGTTASADGLSFAVCGGSEDAMVLDTARAGTLEGLSACRHLYEGLYKLDQEGNTVLGQAASVDISEDGLTYTFTLRDDITWSDGQPVVAGDFVYGWQYLKESAGDYCDLLSMISTSEATDDKTLVVTLAYPCSYLPSVLAFPSAYPVRQDIVEANGDAYATDPDKAVYNGAYAATEWTHQESVVMTARDDYYDAANITAKEITWQLMTETSTMLASFQSGDIIYSDSYPEEGVLTGLQFASGYNTYCALFNVGENGPEVLKDANVRKALSLAIDRNRLVSIRNLDDEVANTYAPGGLTDESGKEFNSTVTPWYSTDEADYEANCEEAKALLAEAGYADGEGFPALSYIVNNDGRREIAEAVISDWKEVLGIDTVTVEIVDSFFAQRQEQDYDIAYFGWYMDYPDVSNMMYTFVSGASDSGYANEEYDAAYNAATATADTAEQWTNYAKCEELLAAEAPVAPLFHSQNSYLFNSDSYDGLVYYCGNFYFGYVTEK